MYTVPGSNVSLDAPWCAWLVHSQGNPYFASGQPRKTFYGSHVCQVVAGLLADPNFRHAYASNPEFRKTLWLKRFMVKVHV